MQKQSPRRESLQPWLQAEFSGQQLEAKLLLQHTGVSPAQESVSPQWEHDEELSGQQEPWFPEKGEHVQEAARVGKRRRRNKVEIEENSI
mmetsp:Transcript_9238/g.18880  ORF Transcript_9238/g.18880 Transcript_9238/m.18880 type:complete len:90 (-) Transcript_9238:66-335(-)